MNGKAFAMPLCPKDRSEHMLKLYKFANSMHGHLRKALNKRKPW